MRLLFSGGGGDSRIFFSWVGLVLLRHCLMKKKDMRENIRLVYFRGVKLFKKIK
jgi:hypothetical protein